MGHIRIPGVMDWNWPATEANAVNAVISQFNAWASIAR